MKRLIFILSLFLGLLSASLAQTETVPLPTAGSLLVESLSQAMMDDVRTSQVYILTDQWGYDHSFAFLLDSENVVGIFFDTEIYTFTELLSNERVSIYGVRKNGMLALGYLENLGSNYTLLDPFTKEKFVLSFKERLK